MAVHRRRSQSLRVRLAGLFAGISVLVSALILGLNYLELHEALERQPVFRTQLVRSPEAGSTAGPQGARATDQFLASMRTEVEQQLQRARRSTLDRMLVSSLVLLALGSVLAGALGWMLAGRALRPLRQISSTARRVADRNLHERIALTGPQDEVKELADTLDSMLERLDQSFDSQQRFIANASHELRTPLAINRTLLEVAAMDPSRPAETLRQLTATLLAVNQRHERLIDGLLMLTSSEQRIADPLALDLAEIAAHVVSERMQRAREGGIEVRTDLRPAATLGDAVLLERLVENLFENAIHHNVAEHGWVEVRTQFAGGRAELVVENSGPVVPAYDLPRLFQPFQRLSRAANGRSAAGQSTVRGVGLGLSIVRSVARAHGGDVQATPREQGGLIVQVSLPGSAEARAST